MSNPKDFVDLLNKEIEELQKAIREPIKCANTATEIERDVSRRIMLENQLHYKQGCLSKNYYYESQINDLNAKIEDKDKRIKELEEKLAITEKTLEMAGEHIAIKQCFDCPLYNKCIYNDACDIQISNYFKTKAKEMIKSE